MSCCSWPSELSGGLRGHLALTSLTSHFTVLGNFIDATHNSEFVPAFENITKFLGLWLTALVVFVVSLSLMLHSLNERVGAAFRFVLYLPAALAGSASVMLWLSTCNWARVRGASC